MIYKLHFKYLHLDNKFVIYITKQKKKETNINKLP